ncbi:MAG: outer membrane protein [Planctomycetota bacterium]|jgi:opacity protein-like surface antigen
MRKSKPGICLIIIVFLSSVAVYGAESENVGFTDSEKWAIEVTPYFWAPSFKGDTTVSGTTAAIDMSFKDIIDEFDVLAFMTRATAWKGNWELIFDGFYIDLDTSASFRTPIGGALKVDVDIKQGDMDFALGYRLYETPIGNKAGQRMSFVPYGGFRYVYLKQEVDPSPGPTLGTSKDWIEPLVGGQLLFDFSEKLKGIVYSDFGGFGVGSASTLTWNLLAGVDYRFGKKHSVKLGYRVYDIDYSNGSGSKEFAMDAKFQGPWAGLTFYF